jgi:hypothetical protein
MPIAEATIQPPTNDVPNSTQTVVHNFASSCIVLSRCSAHASIDRFATSEIPRNVARTKACGDVREWQHTVAIEHRARRGGSERQCSKLRKVKNRRRNLR